MSTKYLILYNIPIVLDIFVDTLSMWFFQDNVESINNPKYFTWSFSDKAFLEIFNVIVLVKGEILQN